MWLCHIYLTQLTQRLSVCFLLLSLATHSLLCLDVPQFGYKNDKSRYCFRAMSMNKLFIAELRILALHNHLCSSFFPQKGQINLSHLLSLTASAVYSKINMEISSLYAQQFQEHGGLHLDTQCLMLKALLTSSLLMALFKDTWRKTKHMQVNLKKKERVAHRGRHFYCISTFFLISLFLYI